MFFHPGHTARLHLPASSAGTWDYMTAFQPIECDLCHAHSRPLRTTHDSLPFWKPDAGKEPPALCSLPWEPLPHSSWLSQSKARRQWREWASKTETRCYLAGVSCKEPSQTQSPCGTINQGPLLWSLHRNSAALDPLHILGMAR